MFRERSRLKGVEGKGIDLKQYRQTLTGSTTQRKGGKPEMMAALRKFF